MTLQVIAHRGLWSESIPENSMAAFKAAAAAGYGIELDVHLAADGIPVVFHDATLERMTEQDSHVFDLSSGVLAQITIGTSSETVPTLAQVLAAFPSDLPVFIETKPPHKDSPWQAQETAEAVLKTCQAAGFSSNIRLMSFSQKVTRIFLTHAPEGQVGYLAAPQDTQPVQDCLDQQAGFAAVWREDVEAARDILGTDGPELYTWTIKTKAQANAIGPYVDGIICEDDAAR